MVAGCCRLSTRGLAACLAVIGCAAAAADGPSAESMRGKHEIREQLALFDRVGAQIPARTPPALWSQPSLSHDGRFVAYAASGSIWLLPIRDHAQPVRLISGSHPVFSPTGNVIAFLAPQGGRPQFWTMDIEKRIPRQRTFLKGGIRLPTSSFDVYVSEVNTISWSPDGRRLAFSQIITGGRANLAAGSKPQRPDASAPLVYFGENPDPEFYRDRFYPDLREPNYLMLGETSHIEVVDLATNGTTDVTPGDRSFVCPLWSSASRLLALARNERKTNALGATSEFYAIDLTTLERHRISNIGEKVFLPRLSPDGRRLAFTTRLGLEMPRLRLIDMGNPSVAQVVAWDRPIQDIEWSDNRNLLVAARDGAYGTLVDIDSNTFSRTSIARGNMVSALLVSRRDEHLVEISSDPNTPLIVSVLAPHTPPRTIFTVAWPWAHGQFRILEWTNGRGDKLQGLLQLPDRPAGGGRPAVVFNAYPGTAALRFADQPSAGDHLLLSRGYAVFRLNERTPHTWMNYTSSQAYERAGRGAAGLAVLDDDVSSGLRALKRSGLVDPARICGIGFSNGGGALAQFLTYPSSLRCAIIQAPALVDYQELIFTSSFPHAQSEFVGGIMPWDSPGTYAALSPLYRLNRISAPILVVDGGDDIGFLNGSMELFYGLRAAGKPVEFVIYPGQGHALEGPAQEDFWMRALTFLNMHL